MPNAELLGRNGLPRPSSLVFFYLPVKVCQCLLELLGVTLFRGRGELLSDASPREAEAFNAAPAVALFGSGGSVFGRRGSRGFSLLLFYGFAFPAASHVSL